MPRPRVVHVVGARPNYMKVAPVYAELERRGRVEQRLVHTGQHYDTLLNDVFFAELPLPRPHIELRSGSQSHAELERTFRELQPELVVVAGDVSSTLAGAEAATRLGIDVCHVESGLRSNDWSMPEEHNRLITDHLSALLLTSLKSGNDNLAAEGVAEERIELVGNTMIDTLRATETAARALEACLDLGVDPKSYVLVTLHRPSLVDVPELLERTLAALDDVARSLPVVFPVHPRTQRTLSATGLAARTNVILGPPLPYQQFLSLEADAAAVVTDSGGIQEETTVLDVPCFTLRANTERPETLDGTNTLLGLDPDALRRIPALLANPKRGTIPDLWDGHAGRRAADAVERHLSLVEARV
jgi:UDP-N-acetylglucosamine 2-epimerase (non-hydrolysing)